VRILDLPAGVAGGNAILRHQGDVVLVNEGWERTALPHSFVILEWGEERLPSSPVDAVLMR
jgi:L-lactate utilization protein LutB